MDANATVIGIDLGGTKIDAARYNSSWKAEESIRMDTEASQGFEYVFEELLSAVHSLRNNTTSSIGIGVPGLVVHPEGKILRLPNIPGAENILLQKMITEKTGLKCIVDNDANCFALAEARYGAGKGHSVAVGITMGTGVGGGIVLHGELLQGSQGLAGEFGHMLLMPGKPPFETPDKRGDVEQFLSGTAMGKRCTEAKSPEEYLDGKACSFMQPDIYREVAWMCTNIIHMLDPSVIIFGGSAGKAVTAHLKEITTELEAWVLPGTPLPLLKPAELKDAATLGAALLTVQTAGESST